MKQYLGVKLIKAEPYKAWKNAGNHNVGDDGYKVIYPDGYVSWSPKDVFEDAYRRTDAMTFGLAIEALKKGKKVARKGWNGKGMFVYYVSPGRYPAKMEIAKNIASKDGKVDYGAYIAMKTAQGYVVPWLASQTDMLAEDWEIV